MSRPAIAVDLLNVEKKSIEEVFGDIGLHTHPGEWAAELSRDPVTGAGSYVVWLPPGFTTPGPEVHSIDQEDILIWGDWWIGGVEHRAPFYDFHPANEYHGPIHTTNGCMLVVIQGPGLDVEYSTPEPA